MRVAVEKLPGVGEASVSLEEGSVTIRFQGNHPTTIAHVREAIRSNGFTPKEAELRIAGTVSTAGGEPVLEVPQTDRPYPLIRSEGVGALPPRGSRLVLDARAAESSRNAPAPPSLTVLRIIDP